MGTIWREEPELSKEILLKRFLEARLLTEKLYSYLTVEDFNLIVPGEIYSLKWMTGFTTWFFENYLVEKFNPQYVQFNTELNFLFNPFYQNRIMENNRSDTWSYSRPSIEEIKSYRLQITSEVANLFKQSDKERKNKIIPVLAEGLGLEESFQELFLTNVKRIFYENPLRPAFLDREEENLEEYGKEQYWVHVPSELITMGVSRKANIFVHDNEKDQHQYHLESCMISSHLVTNLDFLSFIENGGYENPQFWSEKGWRIKESGNWLKPLYWEQEGKHWWVMTLKGMMPINLMSPVHHISYFEAAAFAKWKGCRLPTEYEWEKAATLEKHFSQFLESESFEPRAANDKFDYFSQIHGTLWEWTQSAYTPYPRFETTMVNTFEKKANFLCNELVLRGGSCITPAQSYRKTFRHHLDPSERKFFSGIRLAKDLV